jgi:hypothetical protein
MMYGKDQVWTLEMHVHRVSLKSIVRDKPTLKSEKASGIVGLWPAKYWKGSWSWSSRRKHQSWTAWAEFFTVAPKWLRFPHDRTLVAKLHLTSVCPINSIVSLQKTFMSCFGISSVASVPHVDRNELDAIFQLCRADQWSKVLLIQQQKPWIALTPMTMDNHIITTILHQAITSKGNTALRARVILEILNATPQAAAKKNGYGSLPLHVIAQRNTKIDAHTKGNLICALIQAYKGALKEEGGVGKRTPLHIIFTGE